ncbi:MAG: histidine phosphatase family protein [Deltaproteobacteria bacterium]|nr:histidine phosphatase family protein [Deltaproteobacteria bacterium]
MVKFGLIRHARTRWNLEKKIQGEKNIPLSPEGIKEANLWGEILSKKKYDLLLTSPTIRAEQTSQIISHKINVNIEFDRDLREQNFGAWEGKRIIDIRKRYPGEIEFQESRGWKFCPPGGESRIRVLKRVSRAMEKAAKNFNEKHVLIVAHNGVIKALIYKIIGRAFTPDEKPLLKDYHLHELSWDGKLRIDKLNSIKLL